MSGGCDSTPEERDAWSMHGRLREPRPAHQEHFGLPEPAVGVKTDEGKERWDLLPWDALKEIVRVMTLNVKPQGKYEPHNWAKGLSYSRLFAATQRHLTAWYNRETLDPDTGIHHLAHAGCNILFLLAYHVRGFAGDATLRDRFDDRPETR